MCVRGQRLFGEQMMTRERNYGAKAGIRGVSPEKVEDWLKEYPLV